MKSAGGRLRPEISLTADDARELRSLSVDLERELLRSYETFVVCDQRRVDEDRWKLVRTVEGVRCYRECSSSKRSSGSGSPPRISLPDDRHILEIGPQAAMAANLTMPLLLGTGKIEGSLDDVLYGLSFHDTETLRARSLYKGDGADDAAVIAVVDGPTQDDPFRFLGVVWFHRVFPSYGFTHSRDSLLVGSIHNTQLCNGERVAVVMYHSIEHHDAPERRDLSVRRIDFSHAMLARQADDKHVELYFTSFVDLKGSTLESLVVQDVARVLLTVTSACEVGLRRKLVQRIRETQWQSKSQTSVFDDACCALCDRKTSGLFKSAAVSCQICTKRVCSKCYLTKDIVVESSRTTRKTRPVNFCLVCTLETRRSPALEVVRKELFARPQVSYRPYTSSFSFSSTSSEE